MGKGQSPGRGGRKTPGPGPRSPPPTRRPPAGTGTGVGHACAAPCCVNRHRSRKRLGPDGAGWNRWRPPQSQSLPKGGGGSRPAYPCAGRPLGGCWGRAPPPAFVRGRGLVVFLPPSFRGPGLGEASLRDATQARPGLRPGASFSAQPPQPRVGESPAPLLSPDLQASLGRPDRPFAAGAPRCHLESWRRSPGFYIPVVNSAVPWWGATPGGALERKTT